MTCCCLEMYHSILWLFFIFSTHTHTYKWANSENEKNERDWISARDTRWMSGVFLDKIPTSVQFTMWRTLTRVNTKNINIVLTDLLCVILYACVCMQPHVCLVMAWIKCNHSSKHQASDLDLQGLVHSKQYALLVCAANTASCMQNRCQRVHVKMLLPISIWIAATSFFSPQAVACTLTQHTVTLWFCKK